MELMVRRNTSEFITEVHWKNCEKFVDEHISQVQKIEDLAEKLAIKNKQFAMYIQMHYPKMSKTQRRKTFS